MSQIPIRRDENIILGLHFAEEFPILETGETYLGNGGYMVRWELLLETLGEGLVKQQLHQAFLGGRHVPSRVIL